MYIPSVYSLFSILHSQQLLLSKKLPRLKLWVLLFISFDPIFSFDIKKQILAGQKLRSSLNFYTFPTHVKLDSVWCFWDWSGRVPSTPPSLQAGVKRRCLRTIYRPHVSTPTFSQNSLSPFCFWSLSNCVGQFYFVHTRVQDKTVLTFLSNLSLSTFLRSKG